MSKNWGWFWPLLPTVKGANENPPHLTHWPTSSLPNFCSDVSEHVDAEVMGSSSAVRARKVFIGISVEFEEEGEWKGSTKKDATLRRENSVCGERTSMRVIKRNSIKEYVALSCDIWNCIAITANNSKTFLPYAQSHARASSTSITHPLITFKNVSTLHTSQYQRLLKPSSRAAPS